MTEDEARAILRTRFGPAVEARLEAFAAMVVAENAAQNLIAPSTIARIWGRHILDSLQLVALAPRGRWLDIGTGGGFPGLAVAIATDLPMTLVEPRKRRAQFLSDCVDRLQLGHRVTVVGTRVANVDATADVISARAVGSVDTLLGWAYRCATPTTRWLLPRGKMDYPVLQAAEGKWQFMFHVEQSLTDPESRILILDGVRPR
ncbi:16S rRNA (guanine(527)-N(7))-methyltransferase RsmG [Sphingomonas bacterium]|uniref:16S rRNA (guanine(527)-N(7))-methyltransferase RsmG n=1 Tax=Sphingomonas bacterium TaxID=1895847 RepID=UPI001575279B|nr:16S rRNA (guanine(527)-N(7))-methyltransferase RsmG [Sphingomonas bacterium]